MADPFSRDFLLNGDELENLRLLLADELDEPDDEVEEEEFLLRRLVFELPVCLGHLLAPLGVVSAAFFSLGTTGAWSRSESSLSSLSRRSEERSATSAPAGTLVWRQEEVPGGFSTTSSLDAETYSEMEELLKVVSW